MRVDDNGFWDGEMMYVCDPHLCTVEFPSSVDRLGCCFHADDVGTGRMFGHGQGTYLLTGYEAGEESFLLLRSTVEGELIDAKLGVCGVGETDAA